VNEEGLSEKAAELMDAALSVLEAEVKEAGHSLRSLSLAMGNGDAYLSRLFKERYGSRSRMRLETVVEILEHLGVDWLDFALKVQERVLSSAKPEDQYQQGRNELMKIVMRSVRQWSREERGRDGGPASGGGP